MSDYEDVMDFKPPTYEFETLCVPFRSFPFKMEKKREEGWKLNSDIHLDVVNGSWHARAQLSRRVQ